MSQLKVRTISPRARAYIRRQAEAFMTCTVSVYRPVNLQLNTTTGQLQPLNHLQIYYGMARIWGVDGGGSVQVGDAIIPVRNTYVSIPWSTQNVPWVDDVVRVDAAPIDPDLVGRSFRVLSVDGGGLTAATRRLQVVAFSESGDWHD